MNLWPLMTVIDTAVVITGTLLIVNLARSYRDRTSPHPGCGGCAAHSRHKKGGES